MEPVIVIISRLHDQGWSEMFRAEWVHQGIKLKQVGSDYRWLQTENFV